MSLNVVASMAMISLTGALKSTMAGSSLPVGNATLMALSFWANSNTPFREMVRRQVLDDDGYIFFHIHQDPFGVRS